MCSSLTKKETQKQSDEPKRTGFSFTFVCASHLRTSSSETAVTDSLFINIPSRFVVPIPHMLTSLLGDVLRHATSSVAMYLFATLT